MKNKIIKYYEYGCAVVGFILVVAIVGVYWLAKTPPRRPKGVPADAVFLWAPADPFPTLPRKGKWLKCWEEYSGHQSRCRVVNMDGILYYEGEFLPYDQRALIPENIIIDEKRTGSIGVMINFRDIPIVYLKNGSMLIPAEAYDRGKQILNQTPNP